MTFNNQSAPESKLEVYTPKLMAMSPHLPNTQTERSSDSSRRVLPSRACEECKRKKTKCDMKQPVCGLCDRIGFDCVYPTRRKPPTRHPNSTLKKAATSKIDNEKISRLIELLDADKLETLLNAQNGSIPGQESSSISGTTPPILSANSYPNVDHQSAANSSWSHESQQMDPGANVHLLGTPYQDQSISNLGQDQQILSASSMTMSTLLPADGQMPVSQPQELFDAPSFEDLLRQHLRQQATPIIGNDSTVPDLFENFNQLISTPWQFPGDNWSSPESWLAEDQAYFSLHIPAAEAHHLISLYFEKIQPFAPLFHRPTFYRDVLKVDENSDNCFDQLDWEATLILNGMFALAARFSTCHGNFSENVQELCEPFIKKAIYLWDYARRTKAGDNPTLRYLQGCILVAVVQLTSGPCFRAWLATGVCVRMAYDLFLHIMDRNTDTSEYSVSVSSQEWVRKEEKRRAWWAVFEIDTFASTVACRPFVTDMHRMDVHLPVSDEHWFNSQPIASAQLLSSGPSRAWKSLVGVDNQSEHAWYLVSNYIMRAAGEMIEMDDRSEQALESLLQAIHCFTMSLPPSFRLSGSNMVFDDTNFANKNWVISTFIMIQSANCFAALLQKDGASPSPSPENGIESPNKSDSAVYDAPTPRERSLERCSRFTHEVFKTVRFWSPDYMASTFPAIACALFGPAAVHVGKFPQLPEIDGKENPRFMHRQLLELVLKRFAEYWTIGGLLQELLQFLDAETSFETIAATRPEISRFRVMMPDLVRRSPM